MSIKIWPKPPREIIQAFESRGRNRGEVGALILWAVWGAESLYYIDELDREHQSNPRNNSLHHPDVKDIAHIRWTTGTAISSLDLCAAALGREYCSWNKTQELDLRDFDKKYTSKTISKRRALLPNSALGWIDGVLSDKRYIDVHGTRNPLTHSRLSRKFYLIGSTEFKISATGKDLTVRELVSCAKYLATDQILAFLKLIGAL